MKTTFVYSLAFALAVSLAATGCRHKPVNVTPMHAGPDAAAATGNPGRHHFAAGPPDKSRSDQPDHWHSGGEPRI